MNYWMALDDDTIISILSHSEPYSDMMKFSSTCHFFRNMFSSDKAAPLWNKRLLKCCVYGAKCSCGRRVMRPSILDVLLRNRRFTAVEICGSTTTFGRTLDAMSSSNYIGRIYVSIPHIDRSNHNGLLEFQVPHTISSAQFINLKELTIHSPDMQEVTLASCHRLFSVLGKSLTSLSFIHSCPTNLTSILEETCPNLLSLRIDAYSYDESIPVYRSQVLEELILIHPCAYRSRGKLILPNLKRLNTHGRLDDAERMAQGIRAASAIMTHVEIGDCSGCASNEVICAIASRFSLLESLILCSEEPAHLITVETMAALAEGCPVLRHLDVSTALIWFDEGALEVLSRFSNLKEINLRYSDDVVYRLHTILGVSRSLEVVCLCCDELDEEALISASQYVEELAGAFPSIKISVTE
eukprot:gene8117-16660_t